jgi:hypothetical protein
VNFQILKRYYKLQHHNVSLQFLLGWVSGHIEFGVVSLSATLDVRHSWNVERLTSEGEFGQCEETHK